MEDKRRENEHGNRRKDLKRRGLEESGLERRRREYWRMNMIITWCRYLKLSKMLNSKKIY